MAKKVKQKRLSSNPIGLERLAIKMAGEVYPEIAKTMKELNDTRALGASGHMEVRFNWNNEQEDLDIKINRKQATYGMDGIMLAFDDGEPVDVCPIFLKGYFDSHEYMDACEASISILEELRKRMLRITKIVEKIDSLPTELSRFVIVEKICK